MKRIQDQDALNDCSEDKVQGVAGDSVGCNSKEKLRVNGFCILNDVVFEHILSYLGNQTLTKLQSVTGDRYPTCEAPLARYCCRCENDNPVILRGLCRECESKTESYSPLATRKVAKEIYGVRNLSLVVREAGRQNSLYDRVALENCVLRFFGSKLAWVRDIAQRDAERTMLAEIKQKKKKEREAYLESLAPGFAAYVDNVSWKMANEAELESASRRYRRLARALEQRGLQLRADSFICKEFITSGCRMIDDVVDTMEEMSFLYAHTEYARLSKGKLMAFQDEWGDWFPRATMSDAASVCRDKTKAELCVQFLRDNRGLTIPSKWENCRPRFEEVADVYVDPGREVRYIYSGYGKLI